MNTTSSPDELRNRLVDEVRNNGYATNPRVEYVMRTVARHAFVPEAELTEAYDDNTVVTKRDTDGKSLSCASEPSIVAMMLDQLDPQPGQRILEIGAGTGYNAALLAELVGPDGEVTTVDVDDEVASQARRNLDDQGYERVRVVTRDGVLGVPEHAKYDAIILTVGAWDIPATWREQLVVGGRIVLPLRFRGTTRSILFVRPSSEDRLESHGMRLCGFVPLTSQYGDREESIDVDGHVQIGWDCDQPIEASVLSGVLDLEGVTEWSTAEVGPFDPFDGIWLHTAMHPGGCRISADENAVSTGLCKPIIRYRTPALVDSDSVAYLVAQPCEGSGDGDRRSRLGATGHGPRARELVQAMLHAIAEWDTDRGRVPIATILQSGVRSESAADVLIRKTECRMMLRFEKS